MKKFLQLAIGIIFVIAATLFAVADPSELDDITQVLNNTFGKGNVHPFPGGLDITESGAKCDGISNSTTANLNPTDDSFNLQAWLSVLPPGSTVIISANEFCVSSSVSVVVAPEVNIQGFGGFPGAVNSGGNPTGSGLLINPASGFSLSSGDMLNHVGIFRYLGDGHFHISPTVTQAEQDVAQWWNEFTVGLNIPSTAFGIVLQDVDIEGFHICAFLQSSHVDIRRLRGDCPSLIAALNSGDTNYWENARDEPFYSGLLSPLSGAWQRYGTAFYLGPGGGFYLRDAQAEGWPMSFVIESAGNVQIDHIGGEYAAKWATSPSGLPSEQFGVFGHVIDNTGDEVSVTNSSWSAGGSPGVVCDGISSDADPANVFYSHIEVTQMPAGCNTFRLGGSTAIPITEQITSLPTAGTTITVTINGTAGAWQGGAAFGPYAIHYTTTSNDTLVTIAQNLDYLINTQYSALAHYGVESCRKAACNIPPLPAGGFELLYPSDGTLAVTVTGTPTTSGVGTVIPGATAVVSHLDTVAGNNQGGIQLGNSTTRALAVMIDGLLTSNGSNNLTSDVATITVVTPGSGCDAGGSGSNFNFFVPGGTLQGSVLTNEALLTVNITSGAISGTPTFYPGAYSIYPTGTITLSSGNAVSSAVVGSSGGTGGTPGPVTLTVVGGTGSATTLTGTINANGSLQAPLVVALGGAGLYSVTPGTVNVPVTGGGLNGATVNLVFAGGPNTTVCSVYPTVTLTWQALWLNWEVSPSLLTVSGIQWSTQSTANFHGTGGTISTDSFDNMGTVTVPGNTTVTDTFTTPWPGGIPPICMFSGGPYSLTTPTALGWSLTNPSPDTNTYTWMCQLAVHF